MVAIMPPMAAERLAEPVLVTGATGFIGRRLVRRLLDEGYAVRAFVLPADAIPIEWGDRVELRQGNLTKRSSVVDALRDAGTVFHLAALVGDWGTDLDHQRVTVRGTEHVLGIAARHGARAVLASSVVVYGHRIGQTVCHEDLPFGRAYGPYSRSKQEQERIARRLEATQGLKVSIVRPTNVYGPASGPWVDTLSDALKSGAPTLIGGGKRIAGLVYVDNVVDILIRVAERPGAIGRIYNANEKNGVTWRRYFSDIAKLCGAGPPKSINSWLAKLAAYVLETSYRLLRRQQRPPLTHEALNLAGSAVRVPVEKARRELGYQPLVSYEEGMQAVAEYLKLAK